MAAATVADCDRGRDAIAIAPTVVSGWSQLDAVGGFNGSTIRIAQSDGDEGHAHELSSLTHDGITMA